MSKYSILGIMIAASAFIVFPFLMVKMFDSLLAIPLGLMIALAAIRPPEGKDKWIWEKPYE